MNLIIQSCSSVNEISNSLLFRDLIIWKKTDKLVLIMQLSADRMRKLGDDQIHTNGNVRACV
jgi:hypothetical protein